MTDDTDKPDAKAGDDAKPAADGLRKWPHVVALDTSRPPSELRKDIDKIKSSMPEMLEFYDYEAKLVRSRYLNLLKEGFTEAQALVLCKLG